jgi:nitric oxide reductase NorQ protein
MRAKRGHGQLQLEILDALHDQGTPMTVQQLHNTLIQNGNTSGGQILHDLKKLQTDGKVIGVTSVRPHVWSLHPGYTHTPGVAPAAPGRPTPRAPRTAPGAPALRAAPVSRPGGTLYHPRFLAGRIDVDVLQDLREAGKPVLLYGPPGTGKTSLIEAAYPDLITLAGDGETTTGDILGEYNQKPDGSFEWINGPLVRAMEQGRCFFVDDCTLIPPPVLAALYPAMDGRGQITLTAHEGETIKAIDGFFVAGGHNPGVAGAILTEALSSRFAAHIEVTTDYQLARQLGVPAKAIQIAADLGNRQRDGETTWAPQMRELLAFREITALLGARAAFDNLVSIAPEEDRESVADVVRTHTGATASVLRLGAQIPPAPAVADTEDDDGEDDDEEDAALDTDNDTDAEDTDAQQ